MATTTSKKRGPRRVKRVQHERYVIETYAIAAFDWLRLVRGLTYEECAAGIAKKLATGLESMPNENAKITKRDAGTMNTQTLRQLCQGRQKWNAKWMQGASDFFGLPPDAFLRLGRERIEDDMFGFGPEPGVEGDMEASYSLDAMSAAIRKACGGDAVIASLIEPTIKNTEPHICQLYQIGLISDRQLVRAVKAALLRMQSEEPFKIRYEDMFPAFGGAQ